MLNGKGGNRGIPNSGYAPGTRSDYYMDQLWISLPWAKEGSWIPYESATVGGALRLANCLRVAAGKSGYGTKRLPPNTGLGIAVTAAEERQSPTWVAGVAEVTVDPKNGRFSINRLTIAMDPGIAVNPQNVEAQIRGSALWGASQIMSERLTLKNGAFEQTNYHEYVPIRLAQVPEIDVTIIQSDHHPSGVGENRRQAPTVYDTGAPDEPGDGPVTYSISTTVTNPTSDVDVERAVIKAVKKLERDKAERR